MGSAGVPVEEWHKYEGRCRAIVVKERDIVPRDSGGEYCVLDACSIALHRACACVAEWRSLSATFARSGQQESHRNNISLVIRTQCAERLREVSRSAPSNLKDGCILIRQSLLNIDNWAISDATQVVARMEKTMS